MRVGVISDTHGKLPEAVKAEFAGVDHIIHAGDIGGRWILDELARIAPVTAVRGNNDHDELEWRLNDRLVIDLAGRETIVFHEPSALHGRLPEGVRIVINGHTHRSRIEHVGDVLYLNPGPAGMRSRDGRGPTVMLLELAEDTERARVIDLL
jgi:putative phosphoesterase